MKNDKRHIYFIILILLIGFFILQFNPRKFSREYSGVIYRLGDSAYSANIKISFNGYLSKRLFKRDVFQGTINIGDKKLTRLNMKFDSLNRASIDGYDESSGEYKIYGNMVSNNIKDDFTIYVLEAVKGKIGSSSWSSDNGLMISAPANSRSEALVISNKLMKSILNNVELK